MDNISANWNMVLTWSGQIIIIISTILALVNLRKHFYTKKEYQENKRFWEINRRLNDIEKELKIEYKEIEDPTE